MQRRSIILIGSVILVYIGARLWRLTDHCLWFDEIFSVHAAEHAWTELIAFVAKDLIHPPLFYALLKLWIAAGGESLVWLRLLPVVFSVLALFPLWMLCRELKLRSATTVVTFALFAVNGALIKYAQEVRMYSLLLFLSLVSIWLFSRFFFRGKSFWMLVLVNILLVYTHYFGWFVIASEVVAIAVAQRIKILQTLLMFAVVAVAFVPWIVAVFRFAEPGSSINQNIGWIERPGTRSLIDFAFDLIDPFYFRQSTTDASANFFVVIPLLLVLAGAFIFYLINFRGRDNKERLLLLAAFAIVPSVLAFILSWLLPVSIWGSRHLIVVFPPAILLASIFVSEGTPPKLHRAFIGLVGIFLATAAVLYVWTERERPIWCAWEDLAAEWMADPNLDGENMRLFAFEDLVAYHYWFATRRSSDRSITLIKDVEGVPNDPAYFIPRGFSDVAVTGLEGVSGDEIWLAFRAPTTPEPVAAHEGSKRMFEVPVTNLENLGYSVEDVKMRTHGSQTAFLVRMVKQPVHSRSP